MISSESTLISPEQTAQAGTIFIETVKAIVQKCISRDVLDEPIRFEGVTITLNRDSRIKSRVSVNQGVVVQEGAILDHHTQIGEETYIGPNAVVLAGAILGKEVIVGEGAEINYDLQIPDKTSIPPHQVISQAPPNYQQIIPPPSTVSPL